VWLYLLVAVLLLIAIAVQVLYVRQYSAQATRATKVVMYVNIGLLSALLIGLLVMAYNQLGG
jgi:hypothetical protein